MRRLRWVLGLAVVVCAARAQDISLGGDRAAEARKGHVVLASDVLVIEAGKPQVVELRFRVDEGFHINSHVPADRLLIPTSLKLDDSAGVKVLDEEYPKGAAFKLTIGDGETLDVYQGEFRVRVKVMVAKGESDLVGALRYQACDASACYPPRTLAVKVAVTGK